MSTNTMEDVVELVNRRQVVQIESYESTGLNRKSTNLHMHMHMHRQPLSGQPSYQPVLLAFFQPLLSSLLTSLSSSRSVSGHGMRTA